MIGVRTCVVTGISKECLQAAAYTELMGDATVFNIPEACEDQCVQNAWTVGVGASMVITFVSYNEETQENTFSCNCIATVCTNIGSKIASTLYDCLYSDA